MAKGGNQSTSGTVTVTLSNQSLSILDRLAGDGVYGRNRAEVAARFLDEMIRTFVQKPVFVLEAGELNEEQPRKG